MRGLPRLTDQMPKIVEDALLIYTDGSLYPRGRRGGYGVAFIHVDQLGNESHVADHAPPGIRGTTNNRMELQACIDALKMAPEMVCYPHVQRIVIRTDSRYVASNYLNALGNWARSGWRNMQERPVENADLWKDFKRERGKIRKPFEIQWIKGHARGRAKDQYNARADKLAKESAKSPLSRHVFRSSVRRKIGPSQTKLGSVRIFGQRLVIYIIEVQWMSVQKIWKYRYQVASKDSSDYMAIDFIHSSAHMRDGHYYEVQLNDSTNHPQVLEVIREVERELTQVTLCANGALP
jgi:ribonuclease HI